MNSDDLRDAAALANYDADTWGNRFSEALDGVEPDDVLRMLDALDTAQRAEDLAQRLCRATGVDRRETATDPIKVLSHAVAIVEKMREFVRTHPAFSDLVPPPSTSAPPAVAIGDRVVHEPTGRVGTVRRTFEALGTAYVKGTPGEGGVFPLAELRPALFEHGQEVVHRAGLGTAMFIKYKDNGRALVRTGQYTLIVSVADLDAVEDAG